MSFDFKKYAAGGAMRPDSFSGLAQGFASALSNMFAAAPLEIAQHLRIPPPLQTIIDSLATEDDKFDALMLVAGAQDFNRTHPLAEIVRQAMQWTVEQKGDFWRQAAKI